MRGFFAGPVVQIVEPGGGGGGGHIGMHRSKENSMVFEPFWSENGYRF